LADTYSASTGGGFELAGSRISGRAHSLGFTYWKASLPLHLHSLLGELRGMSIYDFGCAEGVMAAVLSDLGAETTGSDLDSPKIKYAHLALNLKALTDDPLDFWSTSANSLDGVLAFHTLEHLLEPDRYLDRFRNILKPGGFLSVSVPRTTITADGEVMDMGGAHLIGFDESTLPGFLERHGFHVVDVRFDNGSLGPEHIDPLLEVPNWAGRPRDVTVVAQSSI
jgi:SAM-dependent methyltransferase